MFKSLLAISVLMLSGLTNAAEIDKEYTINFTDKHHKIMALENLEVDHMKYSGAGTMKDAHKMTDCSINPYSDDPDDAFLKIYSAADQDTFVSVYTMSKIRDTFHVIISLEYEEDFSTENAIKLNNTCSIANNVASIIKINWAGDIKVGETKTIKLPNNNELYMKVMEGYPEDI